MAAPETVPGLSERTVCPGAHGGCCDMSVWLNVRVRVSGDVQVNAQDHGQCKSTDQKGYGLAGRNVVLWHRQWGTDSHTLLSSDRAVSTDPERIFASRTTTQITFNEMSLCI